MLRCLSPNVEAFYFKHRSVFYLSSHLTSAVFGAKVKEIFQGGTTMYAMFSIWNMPMSVRGDVHRAGLTLSYPDA